MKEIKKYRQQIDRIDKCILSLLGERFRVTDAVGRIKREQSLSAEDRAREEEQNEKLKEWARESGVDPELALRIYEFIREEVKRRHRKE
jgi:chorismate mutase